MLIRLAQRRASELRLPCCAHLERGGRGVRAGENREKTIYTTAKAIGGAMWWLVALI